MQKNSHISARVFLYSLLVYTLCGFFLYFNSYLPKALQILTIFHLSEIKNTVVPTISVFRIAFRNFTIHICKQLLELKKHNTEVCGNIVLLLQNADVHILLLMDYYFMETYCFKS